jgi:hypothetical protein
LLDTHCTSKQHATDPIHVVLPNGQVIASSHTALLPFPKLPTAAIQAHVFSQLRNHALICIGTLCDAGCTVHFNQTSVKVRYNNELVLEGSRVPPGLWSTTIPTPHQANASFTAPRKTAAIQHLHASLFSPTTQTWIKAINNGHFTHWPMFTAHEIHKHLPKSVATTMGHLDQQRKNLRSTKNKPKKTNTEDAARINDTNPPQESTTSLGFANIIEIDEPKRKSYSDLTGRFPIHSSHGNLYVLVFYLYDANAILVEPLKNRSEGEQLKAYQHMLQRIPDQHKPCMHWMDNEASSALKSMLVNDFQMAYQLVPPHIHRRNPAERAIRTFKNHFVAGLCSTNSDFPLRLWDSLLPQAEITLNLLRAARINPHVSAYETLFGKFDYNKNPLMPPGVKVVC